MPTGEKIDQESELEVLSLAMEIQAQEFDLYIRAVEKVTMMGTI